jgi:hypothetical protein
VSIFDDFPPLVQRGPERDLTGPIRPKARLAEMLVNAGLSRDVALDLAARRPRVVEAQLAHWPKRNGFINSAAALRRAIEEDWPPPSPHSTVADFDAWWTEQPAERRTAWLGQAIAAQDRFTRQSLVGLPEIRIAAELREELIAISGWSSEAGG